MRNIVHFLSVAPDEKQLAEKSLRRDKYFFFFHFFFFIPSSLQDYGDLCGAYGRRAGATKCSKIFIVPVWRRVKREGGGGDLCEHCV